MLKYRCNYLKISDLAPPLQPLLPAGLRCLELGDYLRIQSLRLRTRSKTSISVNYRGFYKWLSIRFNKILLHFSPLFSILHLFFGRFSLVLRNFFLVFSSLFFFPFFWFEEEYIIHTIIYDMVDQEAFFNFIYDI